MASIMLWSRLTAEQKTQLSQHIDKKLSEILSGSSEIQNDAKEYVIILLEGGEITKEAMKAELEPIIGVNLAQNFTNWLWGAMEDCSRKSNNNNNDNNNKNDNNYKFHNIINNDNYDKLEEVVRVASEPKERTKRVWDKDCRLLSAALGSINSESKPKTSERKKLEDKRVGAIDANVKSRGIKKRNEKELDKLGTTTVILPRHLDATTTTTAKRSIHDRLDTSTKRNVQDRLGGKQKGVNSKNNRTKRNKSDEHDEHDYQHDDNFLNLRITVPNDKHKRRSIAADIQSKRRRTSETQRSVQVNDDGNYEDATIHTQNYETTTPHSENPSYQPQDSNNNKKNSSNNNTVANTNTNTNTDNDKNINGNNTTTNTNSEDNQSNNAINNPTTIDKPKVQRCIFYPNCTKENCPYFHPTELCKNLLFCQYGPQMCRYIHPPCKFAGRCTRPNCAYAHPVTAMMDCKNGFSCPTKANCPYKHPSEVCYYNLRCRNKAFCAFSHAQPCHFGVTCHVPGCAFSHKSSDVEVDSDTINQLSTTLPVTPPRETNSPLVQLPQNSASVTTEEEETTTTLVSDTTTAAVDTTKTTTGSIQKIEQTTHESMDAMEVEEQ